MPKKEKKKGKIFGVESLEGSRANDVLVGNEDRNTLLGRAGEDVLLGEGGFDHLLANNRRENPMSRKVEEPDPDKELDCGKEGGTLKKDPEDAGHFENCKSHKNAPGAESRVSGIESEPTAEEFPSLDEAAIGAADEPEAATPVALYRLDENSGTTAVNWTDDEGESDGTYKNGVALEEPGAISESQGVHLDGVNDYLDLTSNWDPREFAVFETCEPPFLNGYSVEMWVKFDSGASGREELFSRSEGVNGLFLYRSADGKLNFSVGESHESPTTSTDEPVSDGEWHHVVATIEYEAEACATRPDRAFSPDIALSESAEEDPIGPPRITLYVDGFAYPLGSFFPYPPETPSAQNLVGARSGSSGLTDWLNASVDDVAIYDEPLSEEEVEAHLAASEAQPSSTILLPPAETEDADEDGVPDGRDNCPEVSNPEQEDSDLDGVGDACQVEPDADEDGVPDAEDNCPEVANVEQTDTNENGIGDACEEEE